jgi:hypothetical protein
VTASLDALIEQMSEAQQHRFRQALVRQCVHVLTPAMPPEEHDTGERTGIQFAQQWLADPASTDISRWVVLATADIWDGGVRNHDYGEEVFAPVFIAADASLSHGAGYAISAAQYASGDQDAAARWQIEAARAILHDQEPPPLNTS